MGRIPYEQLQGDVPDDAVIIPGRKSATPKEWHLHSAAAKLCYRRERLDPTFRFFSPGGEGARSPARAAIAKMMGQNRRGLPDMVLLRCNPWRVAFVEFKLPGKYLTDSQQDWFQWLQAAGIACHRVDSLDAFRLILGAF